MDSITTELPSGLQQLVKQCLFRQEWSMPLGSTRLDVDEVRSAYATGRKVKLLPVDWGHRLPVVAGIEHPRVVSVSVAESLQKDTGHLPMGARTLFMDPNDGAILCRGLNKFFDIEAVGRGWIDEIDHWQEVSLAAPSARLYVQRKMAGFVVTICSQDGKSLTLASKHVLEGPHVDIAVDVLHATLSSEQQLRLAADLHSRAWALCCECICSTRDRGHPVDEPAAYDNQLFVLCAVSQCSVQELSVPTAALARHCELWGLALAPTRWDITCAHHLRERLEERFDWGSELGEGWIVVVELPQCAVARLLGTTEVASDAPRCLPDLCVSIRLKAKTTRYRVLRAVRSVILMESAPAEGREYRLALERWFAAAGRSQLCPGGGNLCDAVRSEGIAAVAKAFEQSVANHGRIRYRDAAYDVATAFRTMTTQLSLQKRLEWEAPFHLVMLCGVPGTGKTTVANYLEENVRRISFFINLRRDQVALRESRRLLDKRGTSETSLSKRQARQLGTASHFAVRAVLHDALRLAASYSRVESGVILLDGCHATRGARAAWSAMLPAKREQFLIVHLTCTRFSSAKRVAERTAHETLLGEDDGQHAISEISRRFQVPQLDEAGTILTCNTDVDSPSTIAQRIAEACGFELVSTASENPNNEHRPEVFDALTTQDMVRKREADLLFALTGVPSGLLHADADSDPRKRRRTRPILVVLTMEGVDGLDLWGIASEAVCSALLANAVESSTQSAFESSPSAERGGWNAAKSAEESRSWWNSLKHWFGLGGRFSGRDGNCSQPAEKLSPAQGACRVGVRAILRGHMKWLPGWLRLGSRGGWECALVRNRLLMRFESAASDAGREDAECSGLRDTASEPHVTLLYEPVSDSSVGNADRSLLEALSAHGVRLGTRCDIDVLSVLMDRSAACLRVAVHTADGRELRNQLHRRDVIPRDGCEETPLHITLGHSSSVGPSYAGEMFSLFTQWDAYNAEVAATKAVRKTPTNRLVQRNFVEIQVSRSVTLHGRVHLVGENGAGDLK